MEQGLAVTIADVDDDYLGVVVEANNGRFAGTSWIYAGLDELSELASQVARFPENPQDERFYEFGSRDPGFAGGYCGMRFSCEDQAGHVQVNVIMRDDQLRYLPDSVNLIMRTEAAAIDLFVDTLRQIERDKGGMAFLRSTRS